MFLRPFGHETTVGLTTIEFTTYLDRIRRWAEGATGGGYGVLVGEAGSTRVTPDGVPETLAEFTKMLQDVVFEALANADCKIPAQGVDQVCLRSHFR